MRAVSLAAALIVVMTMVPHAAQAEEGSRFDETALLRTSAGAIASVHLLASQAGIQVLEEGGNAIDAAVTVAFALGVVRPEMTGPGGGGFMLYRSADGSEVAALDFRETAPADVTKTFRDGPGIDDFTYLFYGGAGHRVVGVPGNIAGSNTAGTLTLPGSFSSCTVEYTAGNHVRRVAISREGE